MYVSNNSRHPKDLMEAFATVTTRNNVKLLFFIYFPFLSLSWPLSVYSV